VTFAGWAATIGLIVVLFALDGPRALYFLLAFIGVGLVLHDGHLQNDSIPEVETSTSLLVILIVLAVTVVASLRKARRDPEARAHAGSLRGPETRVTSPLPPVDPREVTFRRCARRPSASAARRATRSSPPRPPSCSRCS
jgi:hypothetical protein